MIETISPNRAVKAYKSHRCNFCNNIIFKGEMYEKATYKTNKIYTWKSHSICSELTSLLNMDSTDGEGITDIDFQDSIEEMYSSISDQEDVTLADKIKIVYSHITKK